MPANPLRTVRKMHKMTFYKIAQRAGMNRSSVAWLEEQLNTNPEAGRMVRAQTVLGLLRAFPELRAIDLMGPTCDYEVEFKPLRTGELDERHRLRRALDAAKQGVKAIQDDLGRLQKGA